MAQYSRLQVGGQATQKHQKLHFIVIYIVKLTAAFLLAVMLSEEIILI